MGSSINLKVKSEDELINSSADMWHILVNLRAAQIKWHKELGAENARIRKRWEGRADNLIEKLGIKNQEDDNKNTTI